MVGLGHLGFGRENPVGEVSVTSQQQEAFACVIEPTNRVHVPACFPQKVEHCRAPLGIMCRGDVASRLVQHEVEELGWLGHEPTIDHDLVFVWIGLGAQLRHDLAVDRDHALGNQLFRFASRSHASS